MSNDSILSNLFITAFALVFVLLLAWPALLLLRRFQRGTALAGGQLAMKVVGAMALGPREKAVVVEIDGERFLLGVTPNSVNLVSRLAADAGPASSARSAMPVSSG